jgi:hypothetical protein
LCRRAEHPHMRVARLPLRACPVAALL